MSFEFEALHDRLVKSIYEANEKQTATLKTEFKAEITEVKREITALKKAIHDETKKRSDLERKQCDLENRHQRFERALKKNNIIIFGLDPKSENLIDFSIAQLNNYLGLNLTIGNINNIYFIGKTGPKRPILVEFISFLTKIQVLKECRKLKGTHISIAHDLTKEDREVQKILLKHKREAQGKGQKAYIRNNKLHVNDEIYTIEELEGSDYETEDEQEQIEENQEEIEERDVYTSKISNSAPTTPLAKNEINGASNHPEEEHDSFEKSKITKKRKITKTITHMTGPVTRRFHQRKDNKKQTSPTTSKTKSAPNQKNTGISSGSTNTIA